MTLAYAAGLFEGEGCINISRSKTRSGRWQWLLKTVVKMGDAEPVRALQARWGGSVYEVWDGRAHHRPMFMWALNARDACAFLVDIEPHLLSARRREAAALGIAFQRQKRNHGRAYPTVYLEAQQAFYEQLRVLNAGLRAAA